MLFNKQGILDIDEMISNEPSFKKILADGVVTEEELHEQSERVVKLLQEVESRFSEKDQEFIKTLFAETNVLSAIFNYYELQNLNHYGNL